MNSNKHVEAAVPREPSGGVRVADSSIFPHVTYANLNGPSPAGALEPGAADQPARGRQRPLKRRELLGSTAHRPVVAGRRECLSSER